MNVGRLVQEDQMGHPITESVVSQSHGDAFLPAGLENGSDIDSDDNEQYPPHVIREVIEKYQRRSQLGWDPFTSASFTLHPRFGLGSPIAISRSDDGLSSDKFEFSVHPSSIEVTNTSLVTATFHIQIPHDAPIGSYWLLSATPSQKQAYQFQHAVDIVFNPSSHRDEVYMDDQSDLFEHCWRETGLIVLGELNDGGSTAVSSMGEHNSTSVNVKESVQRLTEWSFEQFDARVLEIAMEGISLLPESQRSVAPLVVRHMLWFSDIILRHMCAATLTNHPSLAQHNPPIVFLHNPFVSSVQAIERAQSSWQEYLSNVRMNRDYTGGEVMSPSVVPCAPPWVTPALATSLLRTIGVCTRLVTGLQVASFVKSEHHELYRKPTTAEKYWLRVPTQDSKRLGGYGRLIQDTRFHGGPQLLDYMVWNDVFLSRPDLSGSRSHGWQTLWYSSRDSEEGPAIMGPAPVAWIREFGSGEISDSDWDITTIASSLNGDVHELVTFAPADADVSVFGQTNLYRKRTNTIGAHIFTTVPNATAPRHSSSVVSLTEEYKSDDYRHVSAYYPDPADSNGDTSISYSFSSDFASFDKSNAWHFIITATTTVKDLPSIATNITNESETFPLRTLQLSLSMHRIRQPYGVALGKLFEYDGVCSVTSTRKNFHSKDKDETVTASTTCIVPVPTAKFLSGHVMERGRVSTDDVIEIALTAYVEETQQLLFVTPRVPFRLPTLQIFAPEQIVVNDSVPIEAKLINPLSISLTNVVASALYFTTPASSTQLQLNDRVHQHVSLPSIGVDDEGILTFHLKLPYVGTYWVWSVLSVINLSKSVVEFRFKLLHHNKK